MAELSREVWEIGRCLSGEYRERGWRCGRGSLATQLFMSRDPRSCSFPPPPGFSGNWQSGSTTSRATAPFPFPYPPTTSFCIPRPSSTGKYRFSGRNGSAHASHRVNPGLEEFVAVVSIS